MPEKRQFSVRILMTIITVLCIILFLTFNNDPLVAKIVLVVLAVNALGFVAGQIVTHVFGLPRDGSYSFRNNNLDDEA